METNNETQVTFGSIDRPSLFLEAFRKDPKGTIVRAMAMDLPTAFDLRNMIQAMMQTLNEYGDVLDLVRFFQYFGHRNLGLSHAEEWKEKQTWVWIAGVMVPPCPVLFDIIKKFEGLRVDFDEVGDDLRFRIPGLAAASDHLPFTSRLIKDGPDKPPYLSMSYALGEDMVRGLPTARPVPLAINARSIVGLDLDNGEDLIEREGWCMEGTARFLQHFGIDFETEGGDYECCECGTVHEDEEGERITYVESFTIDEAMVKHLEKANYLEEVQDFILGEDEAGNVALAWEEQGEDIFPDPSIPEGAGYDPERWIFVPTLSAWKPWADMQEEETGELLMAFGRWLERCQSIGALPAIPGCLYRKDAESSRERWVWNPSEGLILMPLAGAEDKVRVMYQGTNIKVTLATLEGSITIGEVKVSPVGTLLFDLLVPRESLAWAVWEASQATIKA